MDIEIPDNVKQMIKVQQKFIQDNKATFDMIDRHNNYLQNVYNNSNIQYINSVTTKYDSLIKAVGDNVFLTNSDVLDFYKSDHYTNLYKNISEFNLDSYLPKNFTNDFRFKAQSQKLTNQIDLITKKFDDIPEPKINEFKIKFDELISEPLVDTTNNNENIDGNADIRRMIAEIHESQKRQEKTFHEEIKSRKQSNPSNKPANKSFNVIMSFLMPLFAFLEVIPIPKDAYESIVWYIEVLSKLIEIFFN